MSPVVRAGLVFGLAAVAAVAGSALLPIPCLGFLSVIALGLGAGYTAAKNTNATRDQRVGRGATAGAIAGGVALVGGTIAVIAISQLPFMQAQIQAGVNQALQQNPELAETGLDPAQLAALAAGAGGIVGGLCGGLINFIAMLITGLLGALFWKGAPTYVPAGGANYGTPPAGGYIPNQSGGQTYGTPTDPASGQPYGNQSDQGGARIYDPNDPNRPQ